MKRLSVSRLCKSFGKNIILDDISFEVDAGESFCIIGGSGSGKSVLIKCVLGILKPDRGEILLEGKKLENMNDIGMLFQGGALFDSMNILDNISLGLIEGQHMDEEKAHKIAFEKLEAVKLKKEVAYSYPSELSGGMQKRVALARAIASNPKVIFFDEPTTGLDPIMSSTINNLIVECVKDLNASAISITHDISSLRKIADNVALIFKGKFVWFGNINEIDTSDNAYIRQFISGSFDGPFNLN